MSANLTHPSTKPKTQIKAPALKKADRVAIVSPASRPESPAVLKRCLHLVEEMGFTPVIGKHALKTHGYMAGTDAERLQDLNGFFHDDSICGIFCTTGGFGSMHLLADLDYDQIASHPKVLVGCDDNTIWLTAINSMTGLVTFHGPNLDQLDSKYSFEKFRQALISNSPIQPIECTDEDSHSVLPAIPYTPVKGVVTGKLLGGNLTALVSLMGTPYQPCFENSVLFLEDRDERHDILDRWFTTLYAAGVLDHVAGVAFSGFENCSTKTSSNLLSLEDLFGDRLNSMSKPCCFGFPLGQGSAFATVPLGVTVQLDASKGRLDFLEPALL